jgi:AcrR family transcriptional regulator
VHKSVRETDAQISSLIMYVYGVYIRWEVASAVTVSAKSGYHHGDLRAALLTAAMQMLEQGEPFSLRAVARRAGVSPTAPYRHFETREALESALAAEGLRDLKADLTVGRALPLSVADLAEFGVAYVSFALRRPALFRLMFGNECDDANDQRVRAAAELHELLAVVVAGVFPGADAAALATAGWALAHGLAFLHLDGKLPATTPEEVAARVRSSFEAIFSARPPSDTPAR